MNEAKVDAEDYIQFLIGSLGQATATEAARTHPSAAEGGPAHDAYTRLLNRIESDGEALWGEVANWVELDSGILVLDDSTLDKPYAKAMELVGYHWSGKHKRVVKGINLISLLWTDGAARLPCDLRIYDKANDGLTKNDHFRDMLTAAAERGFSPEMVAFDSWYSSLDNLKLLRDLGWRWLTRLKKNRLVDPDGAGNRQLQELELRANGSKVHLKGYGWIMVFELVATNGDIEYWATNDLSFTPKQRTDYAAAAWQVEVYHRGLKQHTGIEHSQHRKAIAQRNHIGLAVRAFVRLEIHRIRTGLSWFEATARIIRAAITAYLKGPLYTLSPPTA